MRILDTGRADRVGSFAACHPARSERLRGDLDRKPRFARRDGVVKTAWEWHDDPPDGYGD